MFSIALRLMLNFAFYYSHFVLPIIPMWGTVIMWLYALVMGLAVLGAIGSFLNADAAYRLRTAIRSRESAVMNYAQLIPLTITGTLFFQLGWIGAAMVAAFILLVNLYWIPVAWNRETIAHDMVREVLGK